MASIFSSVGRQRIKSSVFNLSEEHMLSCNMGDLVPILCKEVLPGDKFKVSTELLIKFAPLKAPAMGRVTAYVHYFFVPTFQINAVFEKFINPKLNDGSIVLPCITPYYLRLYGQNNINSGGYIGSLADYLGLPVTQSAWIETSNVADYQESISCDPFRVYQHIYNSYYRDQNLEPLENANPTTSSLFLVSNNVNLQGVLNFNSGAGYLPGNQFAQLFKLRKRAWGRDYFTSALPSPQAGDDVLIPISNTIEADGALRFDTRDSDGESAPLSDTEATFGPTTALDVDNSLSDLNGSAAYYKSGLKSVNSTATINDLRRALALQRFKELAERGGTRYSEMVRNFFGAFLKDYWVDRPILLGGQKQRIKIGEVVQTSSNTQTDATGSRAGIAGSYGYTKGVTLNAPCHGYLMGILSIRPKAIYTQGLDRMWTRKSLFDFAFPQFAHMGEQEIYQKELFVGATDSDNNAVFGYTPRYAEYKTGRDVISGEFRTSLDYWHFARKFANSPRLSKEFVMMNDVPTRPFNVLTGTSEHVYVDLYNTIKARRRLPYFGNPSII